MSIPATAMTLTPKTFPPKSLAAKLAEIMAAVKRIPKNGWNDFHKYQYATEADIVEAIRDELAQRNVVLIPAITAESRHPVGEKGSVLTVLEMEMEFLDGDTNESIKRPWRGYGTDKEDKGGYKAMTGGEKYFLLKCFLVPTGDDPEAEDGAGKKPVPSQTPRARPAPAPSRAPVKPQPSDPDDPLPAARVTIASVQAKKGVGKNDKPYTKYTVVDGNGEAYSTFSATLAKTAISYRDSHVPVELRYETDKYGKNLTEIIAPAATREAGEEG